MTTIVTIKTNDNPANVSTYGGGEGERSPHRRSYNHGNTTDFVPAQSSRDFTLSGSGSLQVVELPAEARDLDHAEELSNNAASGSARPL